MKLEEVTLINELKKAVIKKNGLTNIQASDCRQLAIDILRQTKMFVSETTLKRVFGFAASKYSLSGFTKNALARFVDYVDWEDFAFVSSIELADEKHIVWEEARTKASQVSQYTLEIIRNRSGLPFELTIDREFAEQHFEHFVKEPYWATCFVAPGGYGKSTLMARLVEKYFFGPEAPFKDDILWFVNAHALGGLLNKGFDFNDWLLNQLGVGSAQDIRAYFEARPEERKGRIFLFLDGIDDSILKTRQFNMIFAKILDFVGSNSAYNWVKVVVSLRSTTWLNYNHLIKDSAALSKHWYLGSFYDKVVNSNVPLLTDKEIRDVLGAITTRFPVTDQALVSQLSYPLYMQLFYQLDHHQQEHIGASPSFYDLITQYILNKIYNAPHSGARVALIKQFVEHVDYGKSGFFIRMDRFVISLKLHNEVFNELVSEGMFIVENHSNEFNYNEFVRFSHNQLLEYFIAAEFINGNNQVVDSSVLEAIEQTYGDTVIKIAIIQWVMYYAIKNGQMMGMKKLYNDVRLTPAERSYLTVHFARLIKSESAAVLNYINNNQDHPLFFRYMDMDFMDVNHKEALRTMITFTNNPEERINLHAILCIIALLELDSRTFDVQLRALAKFSEKDYSMYALDPYKALRYIGSYYNNEQTENTGFIDDVNAFLHDPERSRPFKNERLNKSLQISYRLAIMACSLGNQPELLRQLIEHIGSIHPTLMYHKDSAFKTFLLLSLGQAHLKLNSSRFASKISAQLTKIEKSKHENFFTYYSSVMVSSFQSSYEVFNDNICVAIDINREAARISKGSGFKLLEAYACHSLAALLAKRGKTEEAEEVMQQLNAIIKSTKFPLKAVLAEDSASFMLSPYKQA